jgi:hypothetical protein
LISSVIDLTPNYSSVDLKARSFSGQFSLLPQKSKFFFLPALRK